MSAVGCMQARESSRQQGTSLPNCATLWAYIRNMGHY